MRWRIAVGQVFLAALLLAGCKGRVAPPPGGPPPVTVTRPSERNITEYHDFTGWTDAVEAVDVRARVKGFLQKIDFREGTEVTKGQLLYEIDPREYEAAVAQAQAQVKQQEAQLKLAQSEVERTAGLVRSRTVSEEEYTQRVATRDAARAALQQAQATLQNAQLQLSFTRIYAPIDGRISRTLVTVGNLVGATEATLLTTIVRMDPIYVYFNAPERDFLEYQDLIRKEGAPTATQDKVPVYVGLADETGYPHAGVINFRDNRVDLATGTMQWRGELPNAARVLVPGLFCRVRVPVGKPHERLLIPQVAIQTDQRGQFVWVVRADDTVEYRPVTTGTPQGELIVVEQGLTPDDWVIVNGVQRARRGARVQPQRQEPKPRIEDRGSK
jgi:RND family efflux transporter MFP subunit